MGSIGGREGSLIGQNEVLWSKCRLPQKRKVLFCAIVLAEKHGTISVSNIFRVTSKPKITERLKFSVIYQFCFRKHSTLTWAKKSETMKLHPTLTHRLWPNKRPPKDFRPRTRHRPSSAPPAAERRGRGGRGGQLAQSASSSPPERPHARPSGRRPGNAAEWFVPSGRVSVSRCWGDICNKVVLDRKRQS